ncbi:exonuclease domain-containing protein [Amnibacterium flavum]|uniref:DNA polymerase III subunit epsilon n=1 Tax=Amnibacterium flavum TaxID=2173173 RepID=A0A2V1HRJ1_9MICO|nr:exonuclease domain-containing protein [Amnibacterium flavum]PVZ93729.1 DNA polymerase III subunit epsilon [Amnibacterium flavum]
MPMDFTAIDFETANRSSASACSVGMVKVRDGRVVDTASWLIVPPSPHDWFSEWNTRIHGIEAHHVEGALGWAEQFDDLIDFVDGDVFVAHNAGFDMGVITSACSASDLVVPEHSYVCSLSVARRTYSLDSYKLPVAAMAAGFEGFRHHDALADAEACAAIMVHAGRRHGVESILDLAEITRSRVGRIGMALAPVEVAVA